MTKPFPDPDTLIDTVAAWLDLPVLEEYRPGIIAHLDTATAIAAMVMAVDLGDHAEPAAVYRVADAIEAAAKPAAVAGNPSSGAARHLLPLGEKREIAAGTGTIPASEVAASVSRFADASDVAEVLAPSSPLRGEGGAHAPDEGFPKDGPAATETLTATQIAAMVRAGQVRAVAVTQAALARIARLNPALNAFTAVTADRALTQAAKIDAMIAAGSDPGPLAGVPFAVKNLFDVKGISTLAGSKINRDLLPSPRDATLVEQLEASGAVLVGALNMGEYAYDFTGENAHDGPSRNPHDPAHMAGGSSGGCGTAGASAMVPLSLGSDTNGSIRVPSSHCGLFGLKPTYGRLSRARTFPFVTSIDHLGPFARSAADLALAFDALQGADPDDPMQTDAPVQPTVAQLGQGISGLRLATAGGYFAKGLHAEAAEAVALVSEALGISRTVEIPMAAVARSSAYLITMAEGAELHLQRLKTRHADFDPDVRDRLLAGAMLPGAWVNKAHKIRRAYRDALLELFLSVDIIIAPAAPCKAPKIGQKTLEIDGKTVPLRPNMGIFTQPISFAGLPVVAVPLWTLSSGHLPIGVQVIAAPWREDLALRVAHHLQTIGVAKAPVAKGLEPDHG